MATLQEILSGLGKGVESGLNDPMTQLGLQLMAAGGYQQQPMTTGQRIAQAGMGFLDQRAQAQQLEMQKQLRQAQMIKAQSDAMEAQRTQASREAVRNAVRANPDLYKDNPLAGVILGETGDPSQLSGLASMMPKQGAAPFQYEQRNPDGTITQMIRNPSGGYDAGSTYVPTDVINARTGQTNAEIAQARLDREREQGERRLDIDAQKAEAERRKAEREAEAATLKTSIARSELKAGFTGVNKQFDETMALIDDLLKEDSGLDNLYGVRGQIPVTLPASKTAAAQTKLERLKAGLGLGELIRLEQAGVKLTPVSNTDLEQVRQAGGALGNMQSAKDARAELQRIRSVIQRAKDEAAGSFEQKNKLYDLQTPEPPTGGPAVGTVEDGYEFMGGDPSNPNSWRKR